MFNLLDVMFEKDGMVRCQSVTELEINRVDEEEHCVVASEIALP